MNLSLPNMHIHICKHVCIHIFKEAQTNMHPHAERHIHTHEYSTHTHTHRERQSDRNREREHRRGEMCLKRAY